MSDELEPTPAPQPSQAPTAPILLDDRADGSATTAEPEAPPAPPSGALRVWRTIDRGPQGKPWRVLKRIGGRVPLS